MPASRVLLATAVLFATFPAIANDSTAELRTGGLVFTKTADVEMRREDLSISEKEIVVRYVFFNRSDRVVQTLVAFPMPDIGGDMTENLAVPTENPENILGFTTTANGRAVRSQVEQKAFRANRDVTALLRDAGAPLAPHLSSTGAALTALPQQVRDKLVREGLAEVMDFDAGQGRQREYVPGWTLKTTYFWDQAFAPRTETIIEHRYTPSVGASVETALAILPQGEKPVREAIAKYCIEPDLLRSARRNRSGQRLEEARISYILTTGANWAGPIGAFRLLIDKGAPENLVSFCGHGVRKISPTTFELTNQNFTPAADLHILILKPVRAN